MYRRDRAPGRNFCVSRKNASVLLQQTDILPLLLVYYEICVTILCEHVYARRKCCNKKFRKVMSRILDHWVQIAYEHLLHATVNMYKVFVSEDISLLCFNRVLYSDLADRGIFVRCVQVLTQAGRFRDSEKSVYTIVLLSKQTSVAKFKQKLVNKP